MDRARGNLYNGAVDARSLLRLLPRFLVTPVSLGLAAALVSLGPLLDLFSSPAFRESSSQDTDLFFQWAFLDSAVFSTWALVRTGQAGWWTRRLGHGTRWGTELALLVAGSLLPSLLVAGVQARLAALPLAELGSSWLGWLFGLTLTQASLALVLLRIDLPAFARPLLLLALTWWLPALLGAGGWLALTALSIPEGGGLSTGTTPPPVEIASILALLGAAWLLGHRTHPLP